MYPAKRLEAFEKSVKNKFNLYNSLFLNLPYRKVSNIGMLLPLLYQVCKEGLRSGKDPQEILDSFLETHANLHSEEEKIDFMFRVIQYVERQVVLYDSVEDAAFSKIKELGDYLSIKDFFHLLDGEQNRNIISEKLSSFSARIVFTAHPTQFYPPSVLDIIGKLRTLIPENNIDEIDLTLQQLGLTSLINSKKPTPFDEAKNIIYFLRNVYYQAVGDLYAYIRANVRNSKFDNPGIIKLGFWPGGDRDGNPFVSAAITKNVIDELRMTLMKCYYQDVKEISRKLTFRDVEDILDNLRNRLYKVMFDPDNLINYKEIIQPLQEVRALIINNYHCLYLGELEILIDKVNIFKTHFATLDIRQDHSAHKQVVESILKKENVISQSLDDLDREKLIDVLLFEKFIARADQFDDEIVRDTISNITQLKDLQARNGEEGCNRYIISNSEDIYSVLFVCALFRWCGWDSSRITFDIVPLFETMKGMDASEDIMRELYSIPGYRSHIKSRGNKQTMMLGFSDGTKDGGYLMANWSIFKTKEKLTKISDQHRVKAIFFDGRGGPPARGGGKTHRFYAAQSQHIANHEIQLTIQGQTITSTYGTKEQFMHNCEQLLTAGLSNSLFGNDHAIPNASRTMIEELALLSYEKYQALKNHPRFIPYLEQMSTLKYYTKANIGSRPGKRGSKEKLDLSDLRAISFVGSWSQLKQNVPGYYGIGSALKNLAVAGNIEDLKRLFREVPFFKALMLNSMMSLSKCNFELTGYMAGNQEYKEFWNLLHDEYLLSKEMLLLISGYKVLMEEEPVSSNSIRIREKIVLPLLIIQQYALQKIGQDSEHEDIYEKIVTRSLYGNINASRNSA
jgi:phosphoenolpyruvate carboxylase